MKLYSSQENNSDFENVSCEVYGIFNKISIFCIFEYTSQEISEIKNVLLVKYIIFFENLFMSIL